MPPKKPEKDEPNDNKNLPPWVSMTSIVNFCTKKKIALKTRERLLKKPMSFQRIVTREELVSYAKEKGLYVDPNNLTDKQKKDPKALSELPTELNAIVMAKAFKQFIIDQDLQGRKLKKDKLDGKLNPLPAAEKKNVPVPVAKDTKNTKKDPKAPVISQVVEEKKEEEVPEKEYEKALDVIYISLDYPSTEEEYKELNDIEIALDVFINVEESIVIGEVSSNWEKLANLQNNFDDDIRLRLEEYVEKGQKGLRKSQSKESSGKSPRKVDEELDGEDKEFKLEGESNMKTFINLRKNLHKDDLIKNTFVLHKQFLIDKKPEEFIMNRFLDELAQTLCEISFDTIKYKEWIKNRATRPFIPEKRLDNIEISVSRPATARAIEKATLEIPKLEEQKKSPPSLAAGATKVPAKKDAPAATTKEPAGGAKEQVVAPPGKDLKKEQPPLSQVPHQEAAEHPEKNFQRQTTDGIDMRRSNASNASSNLDKGGNFLSGMVYYQKQLNNIPDDKITPGIMLECMLDEIEFNEKKKEVKRYHSVNLTNFAQIEDKLDKLPDMARRKSIRKQKPPPETSEKKQIEEASAKLVLAGEINALKETFIEENCDDDLKKVLKLYEDLERDDFRCPLMKKVKEYNNPDEIGSKFKKILNIADEITLRSGATVISNLDTLRKRELQIFSKISFPGVRRHSMPEKPSMPESLRKSKYAKIQAFSNIPEGEFERRRILINFEEMLKKVVPERHWSLSNRTYQERLDESSLAQTLYNALLYEPYVVTNYDPEYDYLYLMLYFHNPPGRILRQKWSAPWKVMPNLENWIYYFKHNQQNLNNKMFYDLEPELIGNIFESKKLMFPSDKAIVYCSRYQISDQMKYRYMVIKEGLTFGIRENPKEKSGGVFWLKFENNTRITVDLDEELSGEKGLRRRKSLDFKVIPEENNNNPSPFSKKDLLGRKTSITMTLPNGLIVKFLNNGDILQSIINSRKHDNRRYFEEIVTPRNTLDRNDLSVVETSRIITGRGTVIKNMKDGSTQILFANGNVSINKRNGVWVSTNNKGLRKGKRIKDNLDIEMDPIDINFFNDYETNSNVIVREDETVIISYSDGATKVRHKDGTMIFTSAKKDLISVEHPHFVTVKIRFDEVKARMATVIGWGGGFSSVGFSDIMERSHDGRVTETYLPDNTIIKGYKEKKELPGYNQFKENYNYLVLSADSSSLRLQDDGEIVVVSAGDRIRLNQKGEKKELPNDIDYFLNLMNGAEERGEGVYTAELQKNLLWTVDGEGNSFKMSSTGDIDVNIAVSLNIKSSEDDENERPKSPNINDGDYIPEENRFLPEPSDYIEPRLFTIKGDGSSFELLCHEQVSNYFRLMELDKNTLKLEDHNIPARKDCYSLSYVKNLKEKVARMADAYPLPRDVQILPQTFQRLDEPLKSTYVYRNFLVYKEFDEQAREEYSKVLEEYDKWLKKELDLKESFKILTKSEDEKDREFNIQLKILEARKKKEMEMWDH